MNSLPTFPAGRNVLDHLPIQVRVHGHDVPVSEPAHRIGGRGGLSGTYEIRSLGQRLGMVEFIPKTS